MPNRKIEDAISDALHGEARENALDFVSYLRASGIPFGESENYWELKYQDECVCFLWVSGSDDAPGPWTIWSAQEPGAWASWGDDETGGGFADAEVDERVKEIAWANVNVCGNCGGCDNVGGTRKRVLGRDFERLCNSTMAFTDPDVEALECAKRMVDVRMSEICGGKRG